MIPQADARLARQTNRALVIIAVIQGWLLLALHENFINTTGLAPSHQWQFLLYTIVVSVPAYLYLALTDVQDKRVWFAAAAFTVLLIPVSWYMGWQYPGGGTYPRFEFIYSYVLGVGISWFIFVFFAQAWLEKNSFNVDYKRLLDYSWQNALLLAFLAAFLALFWLLLFLWASLFNAIDIKFFENLFTAPRFVYTITGLVGGLGVVIIRKRIHTLETARVVLIAIVRALLPLAAFIALLFLLALPFTGLQPLWDTGYGTVLLMLLALVLLYFFNTVWQGEENTRP
ncbi:MAG: hypothetical protein MJA83_12055, partial [Gammaproteobacteria bacterium]|nr:hypothetical protein [Gammaproteobacteria bacterium]